ncbi:MAG: hypothetical protein A2Y40_04070 [Candidatus Margulisbacteria bacterium GWF2_35_9]|nr:MAG: hypothetical protein A2Y40_04070 [Candidatus Margulisbacteria bacterium GWF2_35_9]
MKNNVIKKDQIAFQGQEKINKRKDSDGQFKLELKIPREKLKKELSVLKKEMMGDVEALQNRLQLEQDQLQKSLQNFEREKNQAMDEINAVKKRSADLGHKEGFDSGMKKGYDDGYAKGHAKGQQEFDLIKAEYIKHTKSLFEKMEELNTYKAEIFEKAEPAILNVVEEIVKKVISNEISINQEMSLAVIRDALKKMNDIYKVKITVNPKHAGFIIDNKDRLIKEIGGINNLDIGQDNSIHEGGCKIETDYGLIDATFETKMISIMELLNSTYENKAHQHNSVEDPVMKEQSTTIITDEDDEDLFGSVSDSSDGKEELSFLTDDDDENELFDDDEAEDEDLMGDL